MEPHLCILKQTTIYITIANSQPFVKKKLPIVNSVITYYPNFSRIMINFVQVQFHFLISQRGILYVFFFINRFTGVVNFIGRVGD